MVQASDLESRPGHFTSTCNTPPTPAPAHAVLQGHQPQQQRGWPGVKPTPTNPVHLGHLCKAARGQQPPQPPEEIPCIAAPRSGHEGARMCLVLSSGGDRVHLQSILTPPNKGVINKAEGYRAFHLCLIRAASASYVFWNSSKALL